MIKKSIYYERLMELQDLKYRSFQSKLIPTVDLERVIGVRTPELRKLAKELYRDKEYGAFLGDLPHYFYDENQLHAMLINETDNFTEALRRVDIFLPFVDNWATCDQMRPKVFRESVSNGKFIKQIKKWLESGHEYTKRYGIGCLMQYFLDDNFSTEYIKMVAAVKSDEYYVKMMIAWYFATALAFRWDETLPYLTNGMLSDWVKRKAVQKAIESYRISREKKEILKGIRSTIPNSRTILSNR
ncbi:MAG: DNA alkylation repair protein [Clostridiales bacterium]|nr:DNA alkylation repair protein [Clostridiales bacterium]